MPNNPTWDQTTEAPTWEDTLPEIQPDLYSLAKYQGTDLGPWAGYAPFSPAAEEKRQQARATLMAGPAAIGTVTGAALQPAEDIMADWLQRTGIAPNAQPGVPLISLPRRLTAPPGTYNPTIREFLAGVEQGQMSALEGMATPGMIPAVAAGGLKPVTALFQAGAASALPETIQSFAEAPTAEARGAAISKGAGEAAIAAMTGRHLAGEPAVAIPRSAEPAPVWGFELPTPPGAMPPRMPIPPRAERPVVPETAAERYETAPQEARRKGANTINKILDLFPSLEGNRARAREIRNIAFPEMKGPYASKNKTPTKVYGNVRPQPEQGTREMPLEESRPGVQPQAEGGIPERPESEVALKPEQPSPSAEGGQAAPAITPEVQEFVAESKKPILQKGNDFSAKTGMAVKTKADLDALMQVSKKASEDMSALADQISKETNPEKKMLLKMQQVAQAHKQQLSRETIKTALGVPPWTEAESKAFGMDLGKPPLEWKSTAEGKEWLRNNVQDLVNLKDPVYKDWLKESAKDLGLTEKDVQAMTGEVPEVPAGPEPAVVEPAPVVPKAEPAVTEQPYSVGSVSMAKPDYDRITFDFMEAIERRFGNLKEAPKSPEQLNEFLDAAIEQAASKKFPKSWEKPGDIDVRQLADALTKADFEQLQMRVLGTKFEPVVVPKAEKPKLTVAQKAAAVPNHGRVMYLEKGRKSRKEFIKWNGQWFRSRGGVTSGKPLDPDSGLVQALDDKLLQQPQPPPTQKYAPAAEPAAKPTGEPATQLTLYSGIPLPAAAPAVRRAWQSLEGVRGFINQRYSNIPTRRFMDQTADSVDTRANNIGRQMGNRVRLGTDPAQEVAASAVIASGFDRGKLTDLLSLVQGKNSTAEAGVRYAIEHWDEVAPIAGRGKTIFDWQQKLENDAGINTQYAIDYLPGLYEHSMILGSDQPYVIGGKGGIGGAFKKGKTYPTPFHAIADGYTPRTLRLSELVERRVRSGQKMLNRKAMGDSMKNVFAVSDGKALGVPVERVRREDGTWYEKVPQGYSVREILPGNRLGIHNDFVNLFDAVTGFKSEIASFEPMHIPVGEFALQLEGGVKHGLLVFDTFHASRILQKQMFLTRRLPSYMKGYSLLEYSNADLRRAVRLKEITPEMSQWIKQNRATADLLQESGLNVGRIQEALYSGFVRRLQKYVADAARKAGVPEAIAGKFEFNKWVFEKVTRGAMLESALIEFQRIKKANPEWTDAQTAQYVSRRLNAYFGNLGKQGFFKSPTMLDASRLALLAPQWVESMARSEILGYGELAKGAMDSAMARRIKIGTLGTGLGQGFLAYFIGTQLLNMVTRGHPTWKNPEEGHKLDAWIPDITGKGPGFFVSPLSVPAELTHDMIRYTPEERELGTGAKLLAAANHIRRNRSSPLWRSATILAEGRDWNQQKIQGAWNRVKAAAWALTPTPIPLSPLVRGNAPVGQMQRQLTASAGIKTEPAKTAYQQLYGLARSFMEHSGDPKLRKKYELGIKTEFGTSQYLPLRRALQKEDYASAWEEYQKLREAGNKPSVISRVFRPYTIGQSGVISPKPIAGMSKAETSRFIRSLSPEQRKLYDESRKELLQQYERFRRLLREAPRQQPKRAAQMPA